MPSDTNTLRDGLARTFRRWVPPALHPYHRATRDLIRLSGGTVMAGPFRGQVSLTAPGDFVDPEMLLGVYEREIHEPVGEIIAGPYTRFVDVGAAQGYYLVGIARRCPGRRVIGFEMGDAIAAQCRRVAAANGVADRIELHGACDPAALRSVLDDPRGTCILMDVEGYEDVLLDPDALPALRQASVLVEEHSFDHPGLKQRLIDRFAPTHRIREYQSRPRTADDVPLPRPNRYHVLNLNGRPVPHSWLWMVPLDA